MSNNYAPCFYRIYFAVIPSYMQLPWSDRNQKTSVNNSYNTRFKILFGVPQGSILVPLLFNIFLTYLFFISSKIDVATCTDDNTPHTSSNDFSGRRNSLGKTSKELFEWFNNNLVR